MKSLQQRDDLIDEVVVADKQKVCQLILKFEIQYWGLSRKKIVPSC